MKAILIEVPYGHALLLPECCVKAVTDMHIVGLIKYDRSNLFYTSERLDFSVVDTDNIKPMETAVKENIPTVATEPELFVEPVPDDLNPF